jgi:hypothetical protein
MSAAEFAEWQVFDAMFGLPDKRHDYRAGILATLYANVHRARGQKKATPATFFPTLRVDEGLSEQKEPRQDMESFRQYLEKLALRDASAAGV